MATGFHGIHVMLGVIFLLAAVVRLIDGTTKADRHFGYLSAIWYWHFVDVVWLFLFLIVYYWGGRYSSDLPMPVQGNTIIL